ncbi:MAG: hypothetical protein ACOVKO_08240 [Elstera sp.]
MEHQKIAGTGEEKAGGKAGAFSLLRHLPQEWRERRTLALVDDIVRQMGHDPEAARVRLDALGKNLADDPIARAGWSMSVCAWVERWVSQDPITARRLVDDLADHAGRNPSEDALKAHWGVAAFHFIAGRAAFDPEGCRALLASLQPHLLGAPPPVTLRRLWAMAAQRWIVAVAALDGRAALGGLGAVASLALLIADEIPTDLSIVSLWLQTMTGLIAPDSLGHELLRAAVMPQAQALEAAYARHGTIAAALAGLQHVLKEDFAE